MSSQDSVDKPMATDLPDPFIFTGETPLFALIIGIDKYKHNEHNITAHDGIRTHFDNLQGCVADAADIKEFLVQTLKVPAPEDDTVETFDGPNTYIVELLDGKATRGKILEAFQSLIKKTTIGHENPILIYFAGHGGEADAPDWWPGYKGFKIQMRLPYDFDPRSNTDRDSQGILDWELGYWLTELGKKNQDNITVILDSCHSSSGTRRNTVARGIKLEPGYKIHPSALSEEVDFSSLPEAGGRSTKPAKGHEHDGLASHVLLAACSKNNVSYESDHNGKSRGHFTVGLTGILRDVWQDYEKEVTYENLIRRIPDLQWSQQPECEGRYNSRILFTTMEHPVTRTTSSESDISKKIRQRFITDNKLKIIPGDIQLDDDLKRRCKLTLGQEDRPTLVYVDCETGTRVPLSLGPVPFDIKHINPILKRTATFFEALGDSNESDWTKESITIEQMELENRPPSTGGRPPVLTPKSCSRNLMDGNGVFHIPVDIPDKDGGRVSTKYGFKITSTYTKPLYAWIFCFNMSDLGIGTIHQPSVSKGQGDPCLSASNGILTIGYGTGGGTAREYFLRRDVDVDICYLKLFLSEIYEDLFHFGKGPFGRVMGAAPEQFANRSTIIVPIIQERK
ncbi:hypothetical protein D9758_017116 [Tetrapyrgos nigripes]|uniref:Peptidase C14 caspase domain-containing protein n=1 Tax=Tetrapyrgos nigripes TaxID=182062 RepID=A0A8H5CL34_9AGAR|nr:hypothetical protein D9758_017116 [Tetrapyrgos nigripes]